MFEPVVDAAVWSLAPGFRALSIHVIRSLEAKCNVDVAASAMAEAVAAVQSGQPVWADAHLAEWADVFRLFGAKPQRTPCSAQSLRERVLKAGSLGTIDPVVDLYNAVSLKHCVPVGGENAGAYDGAPRLVVATGGEIFDTMKNGEPAVEHPDKGEVVWRDGRGVTCRRWNWRQGVRTRLDSGVSKMWFVLESLPSMPMQQLEAAGADLVQNLTSMFGHVESSTTLLARE